MGRMRASRITGFLGVWTVILAFLGVPSSVKGILTAITGAAVASLSFWEGKGAEAERIAGAPFGGRPETGNEKNI